ncbi:MAG: hypothetical protein ACR2PL_11620 [Dehalococcoidia bacterium]
MNHPLIKRLSGCSPAALAMLVALLTTVALSGCSGSGNGTPGSGSAGTSSGSKPANPGNVNATARPTYRANFGALSATLLVSGGKDFVTPLDAVPDPDGTTVYFVATTAGGGTGVFSVPASGGAVKTLLSGAPLASARGISVASNGRTLYVADPSAGDGKGAVLALSPKGGGYVFVAGTEGTALRAIDVVKAGGADTLSFTGTDPTS